MSSGKEQREKRSTFALGASSALVYLFLYVPVLVLIVFSFNDSRVGGRWAGFTTHWYTALAGNAPIRSATGNSLFVALISTALAVALGTALSLAIDRHAFRGRATAEQAVYLPVIAPEIVTGVSLLAFFTLLLNGVNDLMGFGPADAIRFGRHTIVLAHVAFGTAFVALTVRASLRNFDPAIEEAARDLGASPWRTFRTVTLPLIMPGVLGGALLAFTLSLDNFVITFFVSGPGGATLPLEIFSQIRRTISPEINAVSSLLFVASSLILVTALAVQGITARRRDRPAAEPGPAAPEPSPPDTDPVQGSVPTQGRDHATHP